MISWENYEEYMIMHADGELQPAEEQELMVFVEAHPELKSELAIYGHTRMVPDEAVVYPGKDSLLKTEPARIIAFPQWRRYAIAAGIAALLFISFFKYREVHNNNEVVHIDSVKHIAPAPTTNNAPHEEPKPEQNIAAVPNQQEQNKPAVHEEQQSVAIQKKVEREMRDNKTINRPQGIAKTNNYTPAPAPVQMEAAPGTDVRLLAGNNKNEPKINTVQIPAFTPVAASEEDAVEGKRSFIDRLPIDESNKQQLRTLTRIANGASKARQRISEGEFTLRVEDNKLKISF